MEKNGFTDTLLGLSMKEWRIHFIDGGNYQSEVFKIIAPNENIVTKLLASLNEWGSDYYKAHGFNNDTTLKEWRAGRYEKKYDVSPKHNGIITEETEIAIYKMATYTGEFIRVLHFPNGFEWIYGDSEKEKDWYFTQV